MSKRLNNRNSVETPEGIEFTSSVAGPLPRTLAYCIDFSWRLLVYLALGIFMIFAGDVGTGFFLVIAFLLEWFYPVFFEVFKNGQTPGKKSMGIQVVNEDLTPISWANSVIRNLLRAVDYLPTFYLFGLVTMILNRKFQRLGDMAAGTIVVYCNKDRPIKLDDHISPVAPETPLTLEERQVISNFVTRSEILSKARQQELSDILYPLTDETGEEGLQKTKSIGAWLLGKK